MLLIERHRNAADAETIVVVMDGAPADMEQERRLLGDAAAVEIIDHSTSHALARLQAAGLVKLNDAGEVLHRAMQVQPETNTSQLRNRQAAYAWLSQAERKLRMASLLADGGFLEEAAPALAEAAWLGIRSLAITADSALEPEVVARMQETEVTELSGLRARLPPGTSAIWRPSGLRQIIRSSFRPAGPPFKACSPPHAPDQTPAITD